MKSPSIFLMLFVLLADMSAAEPVDHLLGNPKAPAAEDPLAKPQNPPGPQRAERGPRGPMEERGREFMRNRIERMKESGVTREEMQKLRTALEGIAQNEGVRAARAEAEQARQAVRNALQAFARSKGLPTPGSSQAGEQPARPGSEKMQEIRRAMAEARNDPAVQAAYEQAKVAGKKLRDTVRAALVASDATLAPIIDKMGDARDSLLDASGENRGPRGPRRGERGEGKPGESTPPAQPAEPGS